MNLPELFIRRPVMTTLVMSAILLFGIIGYRLLPVAALPNVDFPTVQVSAELSGANPDTMASAVATPLEKQFSTIAGLDSMTSVSTQGITRITMQFNLNRDIDAAAQDVQSAIAAVQRQLPQTMTSPPSFRKINPADTPIFFLALTSDTLPLSTVDEYAQTLIAQRISTISGVAQVGVFGAQTYAVRIQLDPTALAAKEIGIDEVGQAINRHNVNLPTGTLYGQHRATAIQATGQLQNAAAYRPLIVTYRNGAPVRLEQLGKVFDDVQNNKVAAWYNNKRGIVLNIQRQPGTNTIEIVNEVRRLLPIFREQIPAGINMDILNDRSESIRESVAEVQFSLILALALVVMVIFIFLRRLSATFIPSLALPLSIVGTFAAMYVCGYSLNNLSLMALTLCVGFVVDDAIVVLENITRHIEHGESPMEATLKGSKEIAFTVVSMTISLAAVFLPVFFMGGVLGRLLHEFAVTIIVAILLSGFISLSLTPMLCSRLLQAEQPTRHGKCYQMIESLFDNVRDAYDQSLQFVMHHHRATMLLFAVIIVATGILFVKMPKGFLPSEDTGQLFAFTEAAQDISFEAMAENQRKAAEIVRADPNIQAVMSFIGAGGASQSLNLGRMFIKLKPRNERISADEIIQKLRPKLNSVPGMRVFLQNLPVIRIGGTLTKSQYQFTLQDTETDVLYHWAPLIEAKMRELPGFQDVTSDLQISNPQITVDINRDRASTLGVTPQQIEEALYNAYGSRQVSTIYTPSNQFWVVMELAPAYQRDPSSLALLYVRSSSGSLVPLSSVAQLRPSVGPLSVNHLGQLPAVTLSFDLAPDLALGDALQRVEHLKLDMGVPASVTTSFQGAAQVFQSSLKGMGFLIIMSIVVIYIILGILYESFIHPITILSGLPTAGLGALITLWLFNIDLNMYAFVGIIMLIGIVKKNAIMMIDFAIEAQRAENMAPEKAIYQACLIRFRPIMMTTMCALMGTLPIALGLGAGAEARKPLGLAVVGGLLLSQFLTLYITPVIYLYLEAAKNWVEQKQQARKELRLRHQSQKI